MPYFRVVLRVIVTVVDIFKEQKLIIVDIYIKMYNFAIGN